MDIDFKNIIDNKVINPSNISILTNSEIKSLIYDDFQSLNDENADRLYNTMTLLYVAIGNGKITDKELATSSFFKSMVKNKNRIWKSFPNRGWYTWWKNWFSSCFFIRITWRKDINKIRLNVLSKVKNSISKDEYKERLAKIKLDEKEYKETKEYKSLIIKKFYWIFGSHQIDLSAEDGWIEFNPEKRTGWVQKKRLNDFWIDYFNKKGSEHLKLTIIALNGTFPMSLFSAKKFSSDNFTIDYNPKKSKFRINIKDWTVKIAYFYWVSLYAILIAILASGIIPIILTYTGR